jgi:16S rRNA (cytosine967-C5)-methyltransferase
MENGGEIVAADIRQAKLTALESAARLRGIATVRTVLVDATDPDGTARLGTFDRVLVDAPCSGLGTLRRNPEIRWHLTERKLAEMPALQGRILHNAAGCVKPGGTLLYSTCSVMPEENDGVVATFLDRHPGFSQAGPPDSFPPGVLDGRGFFRTFPHRHGTDGFFAALLVRAR